MTRRLGGFLVVLTLLNLVFLAGAERSFSSKIHITDVRHIKVCESRNTYCGWPRQCGSANFGNGEIVVLHYHAPSKYQTREDVDHFRIHANSVVLLQRSTDNGETWSRENDVVVWDARRPAEEQKKLLFHGQAILRLNMSKPGAMFYFHSAFHSRLNLGGNYYKTFVLRSTDKGRSWDSPIVALPGPPQSKQWVADAKSVTEFGEPGHFTIKDNHPPVRLKNGSLLAPKKCWTTCFPGCKIRRC